MTLVDWTASIPAALKTRGAALAMVATLQLGALGTMVINQVRLLRTGREIVLPIVPVDPRDLFKGDYVRLGFPISNVPMVAGAADAPHVDTKTGFVTIERQPDATWKAVRLTTHYPTLVTEAQMILRARPQGSAGFSAQNGIAQVRYGIERYYVPEGKGGDLEKLAREKKLAAIVAVDGQGNTAIKGLSSDGQRVYQEPLF